VSGKLTTGEGARSPLRALDSARATYSPALVFDITEGNDYLQVRVDGAALRLAFCGSNDSEDWKSNARTDLVPFLGFGNAHCGFVNAWANLKTRLRERLRCYAGMPIFIEGHSRGGAIGVLAAVEVGNLWGEFGQIETLTTFGAPMPGDDGLALATVNACREIRRYVTGYSRIWGTRDPVTGLPKGCNYTHAGDAIPLKAWGRPSTLHSLTTYRKALAKEKK